MTTGLQENKVTQSNSLIEASYKLSLEEKRLIIVAISKIDSRKTLPPVIEITAAEYASVFGLKIQAGYTQLDDASNKLYERDIKFKEGKALTRQRWIHRAKYYPGEGRVEISFSPTLYPYISEIKDNFTSYQLTNVKQLKSIYSIRLYELLWKYISEGRRWITITDLRSMFELEDKYEKYADMRKCVIEPALAEINKKTNLDVRFEPEKQGRVVVKLWFYFTEKKQSAFMF